MTNPIRSISYIHIVGDDALNHVTLNIFMGMDQEELKMVDIELNLCLRHTFTNFGLGSLIDTILPHIVLRVKKLAVLQRLQLQLQLQLQLV